MIWIALVFVALPVAEMALLIEVGRRIGAAYTIAIVIVMGVAGATLARRQGFLLLKRLFSELSQGRVPGDTILDGALVLGGAIMLLTPGVITDLAGILLLLPPIRAIARARLKSWLLRLVSSGNVLILRRW